MSNSLSFFCACIPPSTTHQAKRIARRGQFYGITDKPELVQARRDLEAVLLPFRPAEPMAGAIHLSIAFTWPWLKSATKRERALGRFPKRSKPDCSNLAKTLEDRLAFLRFIEDDANVVELTVSKWFGDTPGILVHIAPWQLDPLPLPVSAPVRPLHGLFPLENPS